MFDDLIPKQPGGLSFDDLVPQKAAPQSMWDRIKAGAGNAGQAADDVARLIASGATLGFADKAAGYLGGEGTEAERAKTQSARDRAGVAGMVAEAGGSLAPAAPIAKGMAAAAGFLPRAIGGAYTQAGATGAALGAGSALGNDTDVATGAAIGAGAGVAGQGLASALMGGVNRVAGAFNKQPAIPSVDQIRAAKQSAYQAADDAGVIYTPDMFKRVRADIEPELARLGYDPGLQGSIAPVIRRIEEAAKNNNTMAGAEIVRRVAGNAYVPAQTPHASSSNAMMTKIINALDDGMTNPRPGEVLMGDSARGIAAMREGRKNASIEFKINDVERQLAKARTQAGSTWSGGNIENATRQKLRSILDSPDRSRGFTPDELAALDQAVMGSGSGHNTARLIGKMSPQGSGLMTALGLGATAVNPAMAVAPLAGMAAKKTSEKMTEANVQKLVDIIAAGGSRSAAEAAPNAVQRLTQTERERLARLLMGVGVTSGPALTQ